MPGVPWELRCRSSDQPRRRTTWNGHATTSCGCAVAVTERGAWLFVSSACASEAVPGVAGGRGWGRSASSGPTGSGPAPPPAAPRPGPRSPAPTAPCLWRHSHCEGHSQAFVWPAASRTTSGKHGLSPVPRGVRSRHGPLGRRGGWLTPLLTFPLTHAHGPSPGGADTPRGPRPSAYTPPHPLDTKRKCPVSL